MKPEWVVENNVVEIPEATEEAIRRGRLVEEMGRSSRRRWRWRKWKEGRRPGLSRWRKGKMRRLVSTLHRCKATQGSRRALFEVLAECHNCSPAQFICHFSY